MKHFIMSLTGMLLSAAVFSQNDIATFAYDNARALEEVNAPDKADAYPWISPDGLRLYFTRGGEDLRNELMFAQRLSTNGKFTAPVLLNLKVEMAVSFTISRNELSAYVCTRDGELYCFSRADRFSDFGNGKKITLNGKDLKFISGVSFSPNGNEMYLFSSNPMGEICQFTRTAENIYDLLRVLPFPDEYDISPGQLSHDGLALYFSAERMKASDDDERTAAEHIYRVTRSSLTEQFDVSAMEEVSSLNDGELDNLQPSVSGAGEMMVFARNPLSVWEQNELYISTRTGLFSAIADNGNEMSINVFPNPTASVIQLEGQEGEVLVNIFNGMGALVYSGNYTSGTGIDLSNQENGMYFMQIYGAKGVTNKKVSVVR